jgi:glycogen operon protein
MVDQRAGEAEPRFGARLSGDGVTFAVWSGGAERVWVSIFDDVHDGADEGADEGVRLEMQRGEGGRFSLFVPGLKAGARYGFRADGQYAPERALWFDPNKLLADPYAVQIDRPYRYNALLAAPRWQERDTAPMMPKAVIVSPERVPRKPPVFSPGGLVYELNVRAFTQLHPDVPEEMRGTVAALGHPVIIEHLRKLGVGAVELMPVTAWIDERHLQPLGLANAWGYNPVSFMALDPRLAPGGVAELREAVATLRRAGIGTILDLVFNHTGESDVLGPTLSLRGLDARTYYRHAPDGSLVNDTGTGNTIDCDQPIVHELVLDTLRHFVRHAGVDGFRFDLATILGRTAQGFCADAPMIASISSDPELADRVMIAEPWDIGPAGYQLGNFPNNFLEWNDRYRDDIRRFWRGDGGMVGTLATRLAGSSDIFGRDGARATRSVNFIAAHDGMTLCDICAYEHKHNEANGEQNRDGHDDNLSWNNGVEGESADKAVQAARKGDVRALLTTLFASRGTIMLTAGDEFGRTQRGNNNAYAQDNRLTWLDWAGRDQERERLAMALGVLRKTTPALRDIGFLGATAADGRADVAWLDETGSPMRAELWEDYSRRRLTMLLAGGTGEGGRLAVMINGDAEGVPFSLPLRNEFRWTPFLPQAEEKNGIEWNVAGRTVALAVERAG